MRELPSLAGVTYPDAEPPASEPFTADPPPVLEPAAHAPLPVLQGGTVTWWRQAWTVITVTAAGAICRARRNIRRARKQPGGVLHAWDHYHTRSVAEQEEYRDTRAWVPRGHAGGWSERWGVWFYDRISIPLLRWINAAGWLAESPFRFYVALGLFLLTAGVTIALLITTGTL